MSATRQVLKAVPALTALQGLQYLIPLLTLPFLMRTLGLERWGEVAQLMALGQLALIVLDYGFHLSATQTAAQRADDPAALAALFGAVTLAKLAVAVLALPLVVIAAIGLLPVRVDDPLLLWALAAAVLQAHDPLWYFLGTQQASKISVLTVALRLAAVGILLIGIRGPGDAWVYFAAQAAAWLGVFGAGLWIVRRQTGFSHRHCAGAVKILRDGRSIFQLYLGSSSFDYLLPLVLGAVATPIAVGLFVAAEKLARAAASLLSVFRTALFPQMSRLMAHAPEEAARLFRWSALRIGGLAAIGSLMLFLLADWLVPLILGPTATAASPVLRLLSPLPLLITLNSLIGVQWLIPAGRAAALRNIYLGAGCGRLLLCALLAGGLGASGAAWATVLGEVGVLLACLLYLRHHPVQGP